LRKKTEIWFLNLILLHDKSEELTNSNQFKAKLLDLKLNGLLLGVGEFSDGAGFLC
jgi:hypothetical protein